MSKEDRLKKLTKTLAQMDVSCDQLWRFVQEDSVLQQLDELRDDVMNSSEPTDKEILIAVCATLVFGEALKRRTEKEKESL